MKGLITMFVGLMAGLTAKVAIEMFTAGASAAITLLCTGSKIRRKR